MKNSNLYLFLSLLISLILACYVQHRVFFDSTAINDDVRNQIYWMARVREPELFKNDYIASYFTQSCLVSPIIYSMYALVSSFLSPMQFSQLLPIVLVLFTTLFLFKTAEVSLNSQYAFWVSYAFNLFVWSCSNLSGGLSRSFFYPLIFLFLWLYNTRNYIGIILCLCLQCFIYPPVFFVSAFMIIIELILDRKKINQKGKILYSIFAITSGLFVLAYRYLKDPVDHRFGQLVNAKEALLMPEFYLNGRIKAFPFTYGLFNDYSLIQKFNQVLNTIHFKGFILFGFIVLIIFLFRSKLLLYRTFLPRSIWSIFISSVVLYVFALITLFYFYLPQRYIQYGVPILLVFLIGGVLYQVDYSVKPKEKYRIIFLSVFLLLASSFLWDDDLINVGANKKSILQYLKKLPEDVLIAAPLTFSDNIPAFSGKEVFVSHEANIPFHKKYYKVISSRILDWSNAYYSKDPKMIENFIHKYKIDYIVVDGNDFKNKNNNMLLKHVPNKCKPVLFNCYKIISGVQIAHRKCLR